MPTYTDIAKPSTSYSVVVKPYPYGYLQQENNFYILLEGGGRIIVGDKSPRSIEKPETNYTSINKPA